jgi:hypothetical protein
MTRLAEDVLEDVAGPTFKPRSATAAVMSIFDIGADASVGEGTKPEVTLHDASLAGSISR